MDHFPPIASFFPEEEGNLVGLILEIHYKLPKQVRVN